MSINEADKPTVGSATEENADKQLSQIPVIPAATAPLTTPPTQPSAAPVEGYQYGTNLSTTTTNRPTTAEDGVIVGSGSEIGAGSTAADYAEADHSSGDGVNTNTSSADAQSKQPSSEADTTGGKQQLPVSENKPTDTNTPSLSITQYLNSAVNDEQRKRILGLIENWADTAGCDKTSLMQALENETFKDSMHFLEIVVEIINRVSTELNYTSVISERHPGIVTIRSVITDRRMNRGVRVLGMGDGSIRLSYLDSSNQVSQPEKLFKNTPDTDAEEVVRSAINWFKMVA